MNCEMEFDKFCDILTNDLCWESNDAKDDLHEYTREFLCELNTELTEYVNDNYNENINVGNFIEEYIDENMNRDYWMHPDDLNEIQTNKIMNYCRDLVEYIKCEKIKSFQFIYKASPNYDVWCMIEKMLINQIEIEEQENFGLDFEGEGICVDAIQERIDNWMEGHPDWSCWNTELSLLEICGEDLLEDTKLSFSHFECKI